MITNNLNYCFDGSNTTQKQDFDSLCKRVNDLYKAGIAFNVSLNYQGSSAATECAIPVDMHNEKKVAFQDLPKAVQDNLCKTDWRLIDCARADVPGTWGAMGGTPHWIPRLAYRVRSNATLKAVVDPKPAPEIKIPRGWERVNEGRIQRGAKFRGGGGKWFTVVDSVGSDVDKLGFVIRKVAKCKPKVVKSAPKVKQPKDTENKVHLKDGKIATPVPGPAYGGCEGCCFETKARGCASTVESTIRCCGCNRVDGKEVVWKISCKRWK